MSAKSEATDEDGPTSLESLPATSEANDAADEDGPTTFESLPAELRNRIYDLSGCLRFYEDPTQGNSGRAVCGAYTTNDHEVVHRCKDGSSCAFAEWDDYTDWPTACHLINGDHSSRLIPRSRGFIADRCRRDKGYLGVDPRLTFHREPVRKLIECRQATGTQPALTRVSKKVRDDTLPIFYGNHAFVFRMISDDSSDLNSIFAWLDKLGRANAGLLREVYIVCSRKTEQRFVNKWVLPRMARRGVKTGKDKLGIVRLLRLGYPYNTDDEAVMSLVRQTRLDEAKRIAADGKKKTG